jgi:3-hydroxyacyl-CoA dehydrogenase
MQLVELINTPTTQAEVLDQLEAFVTSTLGKGVVRATTRPTSSPTASASPACCPR